MTPKAAESNELPILHKSSEWESVSCEPLPSKLGDIGEEALRQAFIDAASRIAKENQLRAEGIRSMRRALEQADQAVKLAAKASPQTSPRIDPWEYLDAQAK